MASGRRLRNDGAGGTEPESRLAMCRQSVERAGGASAAKAFAGYSANANPFLIVSPQM